MINYLLNFLLFRNSDFLNFFLIYKELMEIDLNQKRFRKSGKYFRDKEKCHYRFIFRLKNLISSFVEHGFQKEVWKKLFWTEMWSKTIISIVAFWSSFIPETLVKLFCWNFSYYEIMFSVASLFNYSWRLYTFTNQIMQAA